MSSPLPTATFRCCRAAAARTQTRNLSSQRLLRPSSSVSSQPRRRNSPACAAAVSVPTQSRRWQSTDAAEVAAANPKIAGIVDQISQLTLLETADLVASLKSRLNIPDMAFAAPAAGPAAGAGAAAPAEAEEEAAPAAAEKTMFTLKLQSFDATAKPKVIKEVKGLLGLSLVDSKKFVESAPKVMKEGVPKEECEKIVETMKALGAVVVME